MNSTLEISASLAGQPDLASQNFATQEAGETPSAIELFSYGVCCVAQGLLGLLYLALITLVPILIHQGFLSALLG